MLENFLKREAIIGVLNQHAGEQICELRGRVVLVWGIDAAVGPGLSHLESHLMQGTAQLVQVALQCWRKMLVWQVCKHLCRKLSKAAMMQQCTLALRGVKASLPLVLTDVLDIQPPVTDINHFLNLPQHTTLCGMVQHKGPSLICRVKQFTTP